MNINFEEIQISLPEEISMALYGKKAIVTGGTGMIGREVVRLLIEAGCDVTSISLDNLQLHPKAKYVKGDLSNLEFCLDITNGVDYLFHVAGIKGSVVVTKEKPASFFVPLLMMNTNMLEAGRRNNVTKAVYTSSIGAYPSAEIFIESDDDFSKPPMDMFPGWAKRMAEMQIDAYRIQYGLDNFAIVRPSNVYGPGDNFDEQNAMVIPTLMARIHRGDSPVMIWGDGSAERDFIHATDCAIGIILACIRGTNSKPINLGCGYGITIRELVENMQRVTPFESFFDGSKPSGFPRRIMDIEHANKTVGFSPQVLLETGLSQTWYWFQANQKEYLKKQNYFL